MSLESYLKNLCTPAFIFLLFGVFAIIAAIVQLSGGSSNASTGTIIGFMALKIVYVIVWVWLLNLICKSGHTGISWFLLLFPIIFMIIFIIIIIALMSSHMS